VQNPVPDLADTLCEASGQRAAGDHAQHLLLLRGFGQQPGDLLQR